MPANPPTIQPAPGNKNASYGHVAPITRRIPGDARENRVLTLFWFGRKTAHMKKLQPGFLALVLAVTIICPLAFVSSVMTTGCTTGKMAQSNAAAATNAYPRTVATIDGLKVVADNSSNTAVVTAVDLFAALAIGGLGVWAKITHGTVVKNSAAIAANLANQNLSPPTKS